MWSACPPSTCLLYTSSMLKKIGSTDRYEIERLLDCKVNLKLWVKVQKNWRDSDYMMKNFGYRDEE